MNMYVNVLITHLADKYKSIHNSDFKDNGLLCLDEVHRSWVGCGEI